MSRRTIELPENIVEKWPEIFEDLHINTLPVEYLEKLKLEFYDGRVWEICVKSHTDQKSIDVFIKKLIEELSEYSDQLKTVNVLLDADKLKSDVKKQTKNLF